MTSLSATNAPAETSDMGRGKGLGKRLSSWQKKSTRVTSNAQFTISAGTNEVESANTTFRTTDRIAPMVMPSMVIHTSGENWAKAWMRKLKRKKKYQNSEVPESQPRVVTLAEQLRKAQTDELCLEDSQVPFQPTGYLKYRYKPLLKYYKTPQKRKSSSKDYRAYLRPL